MTSISNGESGLSVRNKLNNVLQHVDGTASEIVINDAGADVNFRVESDTNTQALFVDGGTGHVGIGTSSPAATFGDRVLQVAGTASANSEVRLTHTTSGTGGADGFTMLLTGSDVYLYNRENGSLILGTNNAERMRINSSGNVGIGTSSPSQRLSVSGNVTISGSLSKGSGSFKINHPVKPDTHHLVHSFIEGPQADNLYRGKVALVDGTATVNLDKAGRMSEGTFVALNGNVQCFTTNEDGWTQIRGKVEGNTLTIEAQDPACTDEVSWLVIGERHDPHMIDANWTDDQGRVITEPEKAEITNP